MLTGIPLLALQLWGQNRYRVLGLSEEEAKVSGEPAVSTWKEAGASNTVAEQAGGYRQKTQSLMLGATVYGREAHLKDFGQTQTCVCGVSGQSLSPSLLDGALCILAAVGACPNRPSLVPIIRRRLLAFFALPIKPSSESPRGQL